MIVIIDQLSTDDFKLGLEKEGMSVFPNSVQGFPIPKKKGKWNHGLNDKDKDKVEGFYGRKFDSSEDNEFWSNMTFTLKSHLTSVDMSDPENMLKVGVLIQLGMVAPSMDEVEKYPMNNYIFVIKNKGEDNIKKLSLYQRQDEALIKLSKIRKTSSKYTIGIAFVATPNPYELGTNPDLAYSRLRELIMGKFTSNKYEGIDKFEKALDISKNRLYCIVDVKQAIRKNIIRRNGKREFYNPVSSVNYGKTEEQIVDYLIDDSNQDEYGVSKDAPAYSIRKQLERMSL